MTSGSVSSPAGKGVAFLDFEASGLGAKSWPVEVGWAYADGTVEAYLIRPHPDWPLSAWDPAAERLHGLSRERIERDGAPAADICRRMNEALGAANVYSDAPDWDAFWLYRLFSSVSAKPAFELKDYGRLMRPLVVGIEQKLFASADRIAPRRHRAADDARHLQTLHRLALETVGRP